MSPYFPRWPFLNRVNSSTSNILKMWWTGCQIVQCGFWIDWEYGAVRGATLTLPTQWALVVGAFVALFVKMGGDHLWKGICFALHQINASPTEHDDVQHQHQLVLRNPESEVGLLLSLWSISVAHKGTRIRALRRSIFLVILAVGHGLAFYAAAGLSSRYVSGRQRVQVRSRNCGQMNIPDLTQLTDGASFEAADAMIVISRNGYRKSANYAKTCYAQAGSNTNACSVYVQPRLSYNITRNPQCPFDERVCNGTGITLDSGLIRSDTHMGINSQPKDAIFARKTLNCVPLAAEKYTDGWHHIPDPLATAMELPLNGSFKGYKLTGAMDGLLLGQYSFWITDFDYIFGRQPYELKCATSFADVPDKYSDIVPTQELRSPDSDLYIFGLVNRASYRQPVNDTWFSAQDRSVASDYNTTFYTEYKASRGVSFLGCQEQYQYCVDNGANCSPLAGLDDVRSLQWTSETLGSSSTQQSVLNLVQTWMRMSRIYYQVGLIGLENLVATEYLWDDGFGTMVSAPLPSDHWEAELRRWMDTSLAMLQRAASVWARPPEFDVGPGISSLKYIISPQDAESLLLCHKIKVRSTFHASFSVLGLGLTLGLSCFLVLIRWILPSLVSMVQLRTGKGLYKRLEWIESSVFQLQRVAAEGKGIGPWEGKEEDIPRLVGCDNKFNLIMGHLHERTSDDLSYQTDSKGMNFR